MTPDIYMGATGTTAGDMLLHTNAGQEAPSSTISDSAVPPTAGAEFRGSQFGPNRPLPEFQQGPMTNADEDEYLPSSGGSNQVIWNLGRALFFPSNC